MVLDIINDKSTDNDSIMSYLSGMEDIGDEIMRKVLSDSSTYDPGAYTAAHVSEALSKNRIDQRDFGALLSPAASGMLEQIAIRAKAETARYFGNSIALFTPLYISNYCVNHCSYCGFNCENKILRGKLTYGEIASELETIAATGLDDILLLTGESRAKSGVEYVGEAVRIASGLFNSVGIEIYPLNTDEYEYMHQCGADFVSIYQETYDLQLYAKVHPAGPKRCFPYRFNALERAVRGGMRGVSFGALLGLGDYHRDAYATGLHAYYLQQKYPRAEISFSVPRVRSFQNHPEGGGHDVGERQLLQVMMAHRLFMPFAGITISTRERAGFRDHAANICATKMSAGVRVGVGGHGAEQKGGEQFDISDGRSVDEIHRMLAGSGRQPVYSDYIKQISN